MSGVVTITVWGVPGPQGSKNHMGHGVMVESSKKVKPWREDVKTAALAVVGDGWVPLDGPLAVSMVFSFVRPRSHFRTGRNAALLRDAAPGRPAGRPDLSKIVRSTEDALTGVVWVDNARIVEYAWPFGKWYAGDTSPYVLEHTSGCVIRVWQLPNTYELSKE
jgi:Holliday junction resolvase RusA-like endonuclease